LEEEKFFYRKRKTSAFQRTNGSYVLRYSGILYVQVEKNVEHRQNIEVTIAKMNGNPYSMPKSDSLYSVKPILKENLYEYISLH
jgi:hypothetical protein